MCKLHILKVSLEMCLADKLCVFNHLLFQIGSGKLMCIWNVEQWFKMCICSYEDMSVWLYQKDFTL